MADKKPISFELNLYAAFVTGMMEFHTLLAPDVPLNQQDLVNFIHAQGKKYVLEKMRGRK